MSTQIQQARDVFASAGINASGDAIEAETKPEVITDDAQEEVTEEDAVHVEPQQEEVNEETSEENTIQQEEVTEAAESYTAETLAEAIGFETPELYSMLKVPMSDGGDPIALGEVKDQFTALGRENETLKTKMTDMQGQLEIAKASGGVSIGNEQAQAQAYIQQLKASLTSEEMNEWKEFDQTKYLVQRQDIVDNIDQANVYINQLNQKQQIDNQAMMAEYSKKYVELIPSWSDTKAKDADQKIMMDYMVSKGFALNEINQMADPRIQVVVKELIDLRAEKNAATEAVKTVRKAPKVISNSRKMPKATHDKTTDSLVNKARETKGKGAILDAARAVMGVRAQKPEAGKRYKR